MNISKSEEKVLKKIAKRLVTQSPHHAENISRYYEIMNNAAQDEFNEENAISTEFFLAEMFFGTLGHKNTIRRVLNDR